MIACQPHPVSYRGIMVTPYSIVENRVPAREFDQCARAERLARKLVDAFYAERQVLHGTLVCQGRRYTISSRFDRASDSNRLVARAGAFRVEVSLGP